MEANKSECEKCIRIAQNAIVNEDYEKASKFLLKAQKLYPNEQVNSKIKQKTKPDLVNNNNLNFFKTY